MQRPVMRRHSRRRGTRHRALTGRPTLTASARTWPRGRCASSSSASATHSGGRPDSSKTSTAAATALTLQTWRPSQQARRDVEPVCACPQQTHDSNDGIQHAKCIINLSPVAHQATAALLQVRRAAATLRAHLMPENRATRWEPQPPPGVASGARGCSQSGSGVASAACSCACNIAAEVGTTCAQRRQCEHPSSPCYIMKQQAFLQCLWSTPLEACNLASIEMLTHGTFTSAAPAASMMARVTATSSRRSPASSNACMWPGSMSPRVRHAGCF